MSDAELAYVVAMLVLAITVVALALMDLPMLQDVKKKLALMWRKKNV